MQVLEKWIFCSGLATPSVRNYKVFLICIFSTVFSLYRIGNLISNEVPNFTIIFSLISFLFPSTKANKKNFSISFWLKKNISKINCYYLLKPIYRKSPLMRTRVKPCLLLFTIAQITTKYLFIFCQYTHSLYDGKVLRLILFSLKLPCTFWRDFCFFIPFLLFLYNIII